MIYSKKCPRDNITIFGESAGSFSVDVLIRSDLAVPYFHRAIGQSGLLISTWCAQTQEKLFSSRSALLVRGPLFTTGVKFVNDIKLSKAKFVKSSKSLF